MATLNQALKNSQSLTNQNLKNQIFKTVKEIEKEIIKLNQKQIFDDSEDVFGNPIGFYSRATEIITKGFKKEGEPFTLVDTGDFFDGFFISVVGDMVLFGSSDPKTGLIFDNLLSTDIFGLNEENLNDVIQQKILPKMQKYSRQQLKLNN